MVSRIESNTNTTIMEFTLSDKRQAALDILSNVMIAEPTAADSSKGVGSYIFLQGYIENGTSIECKDSYTSMLGKMRSACGNYKLLADRVRHG